VNLIKHIKQFEKCLPHIRHHHERIDGGGYPDGLKGEEIPLGARIIAVADTYDALTSDRCYRPRFSTDKAFTIIEEVAGTQLDPDVARALLENREEFESQSQMATANDLDPVDTRVI
jgi:HD-GYP domain-containing protein (c-di-GMP phosphodiesterase class II)